jgi:hypothetical protein
MIWNYRNQLDGIARARAKTAAAALSTEVGPAA